MPHAFDPAVVEFVRQAVSSPAYLEYVKDLLTRLVSIDTACSGPLPQLAAQEGAIFDILEREITAADPAAVVRRVPIDPAIASDADYTVPQYAINPDGQAPSADKLYAGRCNLVVEVPGAAAEASADGPVVLNAHVDVVPPWFDARVDGQRVYGRGACDNKAQVAMLIAQIRLMRELAEKTGNKPSRRRVYHFTIDEETGGNGTLSLAGHPPLSGVSVIVHEPTGLRPFCAHRGCVYYRCSLSNAGLPEGSALEMFPFAVLAMEKEGRRLREETKAPMFLPAHAQTNHGMLGHYGHACGSVCDHVAFEISTKAKANPERIGMKMVEFLDEAMLAYVKIYGDKSRETDPTTGKPKLARHFEVKVTPGPEYHIVHLHIYGKGGHMAVSAECDNAITKAAWLLAAMMQMSQRFPGVRAFGRLLDEKTDVADADAGRVPSEIVLQGGQGFTPSHRMEDVKARLAAAAARGVQKYCAFKKIAFRDDMVRMSFDLLHNDAYAASPDIEPMQALKSAFAALGEPWPAPVAWESSCDARIYHHKGYPTAIFGAGHLNVTHGPDEHVDLADVQKALAISTLATLAMSR